VGAGSCKDFVWSKEFLGEFLEGSSHVEELSLDVCLATNLEFWGHISLRISRSLVFMVIFSDVLLELLV